jgi:hypothetical protein
VKIDFRHIQSAHCENGVTTNLLQHAGIHQITEPLAFGIGAGIFYIHIPFLKIQQGPAISFRSAPGSIFRRTCHALRVKMVHKTFRNKEKARQYLDRCLENHQPVGCQVGVYFLTYFPKEFRFHFNAHNLVVYGKEGDHYLISDPVMETVTTLSSMDLERVRFAQGPLAPQGHLYYPAKCHCVSDEMIAHAIVKGIKHASWMMTKTHVPFIGTNGIRYTARQIVKWRQQLGVKTAGAYLAHLVRMQEEIGTGGGGFRFIYAAFLQQAYRYISDDVLLCVSNQFSEIGDCWRAAAVQAAGIYRGRHTEPSDFTTMSNMLLDIAAKEQAAFALLLKHRWKY